MAPHAVPTIYRLATGRTPKALDVFSLHSTTYRALRSPTYFPHTTMQGPSDHRCRSRAATVHASYSQIGLRSGQGTSAGGLRMCSGLGPTRRTTYVVRLLTGDSRLFRLSTVVSKCQVFGR